MSPADSALNKGIVSPAFMALPDNPGDARVIVSPSLLIFTIFGFGEVPMISHANIFPNELGVIFTSVALMSVAAESVTVRSAPHITFLGAYVPTTSPVLLPLLS